MIEQSLTIRKQLRDMYTVGKSHQFLGWLDHDAGDTAGAIAHFREMLLCFAQVRSPDAEDVRADLREMGVEE